jgi:hypothetical protein
MVPMPGFSGRTELKCVFCDKLDPMEMDAANKGPKARLSLLFPNVP